jgi:hypothetical protein
MRLRLLMLTAITAVAGSSCASSSAPPPTVPTRPSDLITIQQNARPEHEASASSITQASIRGHLEFLASDAMNGRGSGTREEWMAAQYVASAFASWGLEPMGDEGGFIQTIGVSDLELAGMPSLEAGPVRLLHGREMLVWLMHSPTVSGQIVKYTGQVSVPMGSVVLMPADGSFEDTSVPGASLLILPAGDRERQGWQQRASTLPTVPTEITKLAAAPPAQPSVVYVTPEGHAALDAVVDRSVVTLRAESRVTRRWYTWNVVGRLTGSDRTMAEQVIVLGAHIDHLGTRGEEGGAIYNGADDDASGVVAVMELAQAIAKGPRPKRTIVFALFGSEERGGMGARYFVRLPVVPLERLIAQLQFEMIGRPDASVPEQTLWLTGFERSNLGEALAEHGARLVADPHTEQRFFQRSDNIRFARAGVVAHTVSSFGLHEDYHRPSDDVDRIDFAHMTTAIRSMLGPIRWLANSTFVPEWNPGGRPR